MKKNKRSKRVKRTGRKEPTIEQVTKKTEFDSHNRKFRLARFFEQQRVQLAVVVFFALLLRLINLLQMKLNSPFYELPTTDSAFYNELAVKIAEGEWLGSEVFYYNPFYPYLLGVLYSIFGPSLTIAKIIQLFIGTGTCVLIYLLGKRLSGPTVGFIAGLLAAFYGLFIFYDDLILPSTISLFLYTLTILMLLLAKDKPSPSRVVAAGFSLGLAFLCRPTVLPFVAAIWVIVVLRKEGGWFIVSRLAILTVTSVLVVLPVTIRNYKVGDDLVLVSSHSGITFYLCNNPYANEYFTVPKSIPATLADHPTEIRDYFTAQAEKELNKKAKPSEISSYWTSKGFDFISKNPGQWLKTVYRKFRGLLDVYEFSDNQNYYFSMRYSSILSMPVLLGFGFVCPLALLGMILCWSRRKEFALLYIFIGAYGASLMFFFANSRFRLLLVPFIIIFTAYALDWMKQKLYKSDFKPFAFASVLLIFFVLIVNTDIFGEYGYKEKIRYTDYYNVGNKFQIKGRLDEAVNAYETSIKMKSNYLSSHNNLAVVYEKKKDWEKARSEWNKVLKLARKKGSPIHIKRSQNRIKLANRHLNK